MRRPQFSVKSMLWLTVVVAAFLGGMSLQSKLDEPKPFGSIMAFQGLHRNGKGLYGRSIQLRDGSVWEQRFTEDEAPELFRK